MTSLDYDLATSGPDTANGEFNAADYLVDRRLRAGDGDRVAVVTPTRTLSYQQLHHETCRVAAGLYRLGVRPEERVLMCMTDDIELFTAILATMRIGAIAVPASTMLTGSELRVLVTDSRARVVLASDEYSPAVRTAAASSADVRHLVWCTNEDSECPNKTENDIAESGALVAEHDWSQLSAAPASESEFPYRSWPDSPALWLYTSGTTGTPKAAMHRHVDIRVVAENYAHQVLGVTARDRFLSVAKLFFAYGIGNSMFFPLSVGGCALLEPRRPSPSLLAERAARDRATLLFGTPSFWGPLLAGDVSADSFRSVRQGISAGEALPARMYHGMSERFGIEVLDGIGSTELLHIFMSNRPGEVHPGSSGVPVPGYQVEIRDENGTPITESERAGELYVRGESAATGYWCRADTTRQVFCGEWMRTGDTYQRNTDGTYTCLGRSGDMLKAGGIWVSPSEVEERLLQHDDVAEAVVVAAPDSDELDKPVACVVPKPGREIDAEDLITWCRQALASFKRPRGVLELAELPKTATGKIRRNVLRELVRSDQAGTIRGADDHSGVGEAVPEVTP